MAWLRDINNNTVLITGASSGIGKACAYKFAEQGANLILVSRRESKLAEIRADILKNNNIECTNIVCDVTSTADLAILKDAIANKNIDILLNNAGLALGMSKIQDDELANWDVMIDTNIKGLLYVTRLILPLMIKRNLGHIINVGSIAGHDVYATGGVYCATKHAVHAISKTLRLDLLGTDIRVTEMCPGLVETEFSIVRHKGDISKAKSTYAGIQPLIPEDIAEIILYATMSPSHVNISELIVTPTAQAGVGAVYRKELI